VPLAVAVPWLAAEATATEVTVPVVFSVMELFVEFSATVALTAPAVGGVATFSVVVLPVTPTVVVLEVGAPLGMMYVLAEAATTSTWKVQLLLGGMDAPVMERALAPAEGAKVAVEQPLVPAFGVLATVTPLGSVMLSATPVTMEVVPPVIAKVSVAVPPGARFCGLAETLAAGAGGGSRIVTVQARSVLKSELVSQNQL